MLRRISTTRLLVSLLALVALVAAATAVTALAVDSGPTPPPRPLAQAIHDSLSHGAVDGLSADITFTNTLISSTSLGSSDGSGLGAASPLLTGGSGRLWIGDGKARLELQGTRGDTEIVVSGGKAMIDDVPTNSVYEFTLPSTGATGTAPPTAGNGAQTVPSVASIERGLTRLMGAVDIGGAVPTNIGGAPAYTVTITPKHPAGLLGAAEIGWDAVHGIPLDVAIYAAGTSTPVLALTAGSVSFGPVDPSVFSLTPAPGAHVVSIAAPRVQPSRSNAARQPLTASGFDAVSAALPFALDAPATLGGLDRGRVSMIDWNGRSAALALYGSGLASVAVVETTASPSSHGGASSGILGSLPRVAVNGASASELQTALGTVVEFSRGGVQYAVAGLVEPSRVEAVARGL